MNPWENDPVVSSAGPWMNDPVEQPAKSTVLGVASQVAGGFNKSLADIAEFPRRLGHAITEPIARKSIELVTGQEREPMTYEQVREAEWTPATDWLRNSVPPPQTTAERYGRRVGEVVGENVPYAAIPFAGAMARTPQALKGSTALSRGVDAFMTGIRNTPGRAVTGEGLATIGAGLGSQTAREINPDSPALDMGLSIAGGFAPSTMAYTPAALLKRGYDATARRISSDAQRNAAREQVSDVLGNELTPSAEAALREADRLRNEIPGFSPTLAEATGSPSLVATQRQIEGRANGQALDSLNARRDSNVSAIAAFADRVGPSGYGEPEFVIDTARSRVESLTGKIGRERDGLATVARTQATNLPSPNVSSEGQGLRNALLDRRDEAKVRMTRLADQMGINDADITVSFRRAQEELAEEFAPRSAFEDTANRPKVLDDVLNYGKRSDSATRSMLQEMRSGYKPRSLFQFLRSKGGIQDQGGELKGMDLKGSSLVRSNGMNLDDAANAATEAGYFPGKDRASIRELLDAVDQEARGKPVYSFHDAEDVARVQNLDGFQRDLDQAGIDPNLPDGEILRRLDYASQGNGPTVTFQDLMGLRSRISDDLRDALGTSNPSAKKVRTLTALEKRLDGVIERLTMDTDPTLASRYKEFRKAYKTEYINRFNQGAAYKVRARDGRGYYQVPDERVAETFWKTPDGIRQFKSTFGTEAAETSALESVALDDLRLSAVRDGEIKPGLLQAWKRKHEAALKEFPGLRDQIAKIEDATNAIARRNAELTRRERSIEQSLLTRELRAFERGKPAEDVIAAAVKEPRKMAQLANRLRQTPGALDALRRNVWDSVANATPTEMRAFLRDNAKSLRHVLTPDHFRHLNTIMRAGEMAARVPKASGRGYEVNSLAGVESALGTGMNQIGSRIFAAQSGRTSWRYIGLDLAGRFLRGFSQQEAARLLEEALYNPDVARDLANVMHTKRTAPAVAKRLNTWLLTVGEHD